MVAVRSVLVFGASCVVAVLASCVMTPRNTLATSSDRLESSAHALAVNARDDAGYPVNYSRDARLLADDARELRHIVEGRGGGEADVRVAFERVSRSYHVVRDEVDDSDNRAARVALQPVTESYLDVERAMGGYPARESHLAGER
jgi:hypothetical protein